MLGNPIIWWGNLLFLAIFIFLLIHAAVREQRGFVESTAGVEQRRKIMNAGGWIFIGWLLHYVPFWAMTRILYFHHYFPALLFNSMLTAITLDHIAESILIFFPKRIGKTVYHVLAACFISTVVYR